jgi:hypothetical protein
MYGDQDLGNLLGSFQPQSNVIKQDRVDKGIYKELMSACQHRGWNIPSHGRTFCVTCGRASIKQTRALRIKA